MPAQRILAQLSRDSVRSSVEAAHACFQYLLDLPPLRRDKLRYLPDFAFALISFCSLYVIRAIQLFGKTIPALGRYIPSVQAISTLMQELGVGNSTSPRFYGDLVLQQLGRVTLDPTPNAWEGSATPPSPYRPHEVDRNTQCSPLYGVVIQDEQ
jgi:hypothetical protein